MAPKIKFKQHKPVGFGDGYVKGSVEDQRNRAKVAKDERQYKRDLKRLEEQDRLYGDGWWTKLKRRLGIRS
jgi:hypothetical protein